MKFSRLIVAVLGMISVAVSAAQSPTTVLPLRTMIQPFHGDGRWTEAQFNASLDNSKTAIIITDMWDKHWCPRETEYVKHLAVRMEPLLEKARNSGMLIIHAPSSTMKFYANAPGRLLAQNAPHSEPPAELQLPNPPLPIDDSDGGCNTPAKQYDAWSREIKTLSIKPGDAISDSGEEIYNVLKQRQIETVLYVGVASNMCVLDRTFGIKQMSKWGVRSILVRDMTDSMYDSKMKPYVSHEEGNKLVIQYIEQYWAPTVTSSQLIGALSGSTNPSHKKQ